MIGTHNSPARAELLRTLGAKPVLLDLLDAGAVREAVLENEPEAIVHEATALANAKFGRSLDKAFASTNALRTRGTDTLLAGAWEAGVRRVVAQSFAPYRYAREGGPVKTADDPLDPTPPPNTQESYAAMAYFSWIHLDDAAAATVLALEHAGPAVYNIVDDEPAPVREWLPVLAQAMGAKPPRHFPAWLARLFAGEAAVAMGTESRGASNAKAKRELGWKLRYPSWRQGFPATYSALSVADRPTPRPAARTRSHS